MSTWKCIIGLKSSLLNLNVNLDSIFTIKVGNGNSFAFWNDKWYGDQKFKTLFPRLYSLETMKDCKIVDRCNNHNGPFTRTWQWRRSIRDGEEKQQLCGLLNTLQHFDLSLSSDCWEYTLATSRNYSVSSFGRYIEERTLLSVADPIRWNRLIPIKLNIHSWRVAIDRLPTWCNLDSHGIDLDSTRCPICDDALETSLHLFVECDFYKSIWEWFTKWWGFDDYLKSLADLISWADSTDLPCSTKTCFDAVIQTMLWLIWRFRNRTCFDSKPQRKDTIGNDILIHSHTWIASRNRRKLNLVWLDWIVNPKSTCCINL
ncbi:RNA-directed DNA polymerase, eukaryota, reverse transcriptase zinc-binding domain protein [Tanacetum coccineum]